MRVAAIPAATMIQNGMRQPKALPMAVPSGTPMIVAMLTPAVTTEIAVAWRPGGASLTAMTMATPKKSPWQAARTSRAASSMP